MVIKMPQYIKISGVKFPTTNEPEFPYLYYNNNYSNLEETDNSDYNLAFNNKYYKKKEIAMDPNAIRLTDKYKMKDLYPNVYYSMTEIPDNIEVFDVSRLTKLDEMFEGCRCLIKFPKLIGTNKITSMAKMFSDCEAVTDSSQIPELDTSNVTNFFYMFNRCNFTSSPKIDTRNATDLSYMFFWCQKLTDISQLQLDTSKATNMALMFNQCPLVGDFPYIIDCININELSTESGSRQEITGDYWYKDLYGMFSTNKDVRRRTLNVRLKNLKEELKPYIMKTIAYKKYYFGEDVNITYV